MKITFSISFILLLITSPAYSCLNESRLLLNGQKTVGHMSFVPYYHSDYYNNAYYEKKLAELDSLWKINKQMEDYSDYGVVLVHLGDYQKALKVFQEIEKKKPGLYSTAANMGTTYELLGINDKAYQWIKKAIKINPESHRGSEWIHLKILEVKLKGDEYITSENVLGTSFGNDSIPKSKLDSSKLESLKEEIYYQLNERMNFIKPKDKIVGLLLFELGNITALTDDATTAMRNYELAKEYGYASTIFEQRYSYVKNLHKGFKPENVTEKTTIVYYPSKKYILIYLSIAATATILLFFIIRFIRKRKKQNFL